MAQNYYHGERSPQINAYLAASAWNLKKLMIKLKKLFLGLIFAYFWRPLSIEHSNYALQVSWK